MYLDELFDALIVRSGQFILAPSDIELDSAKFLRLVRVALGKYNNYRPHDEVFSLKLYSKRSYVFDDNFNSLNTGIKLGIPKGVSSVTPTEVAGSPAFNLQFVNSYGFTGYGMNSFNSGTTMSPVNPDFSLTGQAPQQGVQMQKSNFPWVYQNNTLYIPYSARVEILAFWSHPVIIEDATGTAASKINLPTITYDDAAFFDLLQGMFLKALGVSRRSFTINDLPIITDASDIASEGQSLEEAAMDELKNDKAKFYLAFGD